MVRQKNHFLRAGGGGVVVLRRRRRRRWEEYFWYGPKTSLQIENRSFLFLFVSIRPLVNLVPWR